MVEVKIFRSITATTIFTIITPLQVLLLTWDQKPGYVRLFIYSFIICLSDQSVSSTRGGTVCSIQQFSTIYLLSEYTNVFEHLLHATHSLRYCERVQK